MYIRDIIHIYICYWHTKKQLQSMFSYCAYHPFRADVSKEETLYKPKHFAIK